MKAIFLDLDGTLMDSKPGIESSLRHAFQETGHDELAASDLTWMIGPPFQDSFARAGVRDPDKAIALYRAHYQASGMFTASVYDGVFDMLDTLADTGAELFIATAKPHAYARLITAHFGLSRYMVAEFGPELDGTRAHKGDLLAYALQETGHRPDSSVMVGDRHHDMDAGARVGMPTIAVTWGYGSEDEWTGAAARIDRPAELAPAIASLG
ncbi:HAD hydrolase-like protein [Alphaproteobacteria bacterium GH1-50]|uniref:HAD hydrolase-like protein n=1 Tax=Kangsaoukella pontilimi TaxID=2691042 RepID=A0A7C9NGC4_9RHOB|nr:HAD hydrolase-like protein [Kangsaoukella pontilimi]MXQ09379.1 HAD hydrolase-like protein [Kangsaoukella pontilimi]